MTLAGLIPIMMQPSIALDFFVLKTDIRLPYKLVGGNPSLLSVVYPGMQTGLFLKKGDTVVHQAETRGGKLFLNGKEVLLN
ncbi:hypothetical protein [Desulfobacula sp.]